MRRMMLLLGISMLICSCSKDIRIAGEIGESPEIFPDYKDITIPVNIAPMNFQIITEASDAAVIVNYGDSEKVIMADDGLVSFGSRFWKSLLRENAGKTVSFTVCEKTKDGWRTYDSFVMNVAEEETDPYLAYRLIPPGYTMWSEMGIYQRDLETYDQTLIYSNLQGRGNCVNCHSFPNRDSDKFLLHFRSELGGTYIVNDGEIEKLNTKTDSTMSALVYPYWHPSEKYVAFTVNITNEVVHTKNPNRVEVLDEASDVVIYDIENHEVVTCDLLSAEKSFETFPTFSPDGRSLYFCSAKAVGPMPEKFREAKYSLCRIDFDPQTCSFGDKVDTLFNARLEDRSVSFPRVSPDGNHLAFVVSDYGNFSLWHKEADLYSVNLKTGVVSEMEQLNSDDSESYHSWSGNSRWLVFSSRRDDGLYTKPYFAYIDEEGQAHKPFLLPQKDPKAYYDAQMYAYNIPEFVDGKVKTRGSDIAAFAKKDSGIQLTFRRK